MHLHQTMPESLKTQALRCLSRRDYSREGLRRKLAPNADSEAVLTGLLDELQARQLLSDERYASQRVASRGTRFGNARLARELQQQGVAEVDIEAALQESGEEVFRCHQVWLRKFGVVPDSREARAKQQRFLLYRGFSNEAIRQVLRGLEEE